MDWNLIRSYFPATQNYVYLNPAGGSPMPVQAASEGKLFYDQMLSGGDAYWDEWLEKQETVRQKLATFINASPDEVAFTQNTSHAMSIVASMLVGKGSVLTMHDEFPSSTYPWLHKGYNVKFVSSENGKYTFDAIKASLTSDVKILITSYVQYNTGFRQDLEEVGKFCKERGLIFVVNATQGMGSMPIDVEKFNADFLVFTGLKWTFAGYGIGGIYINNRWSRLLKFPAAGWRSVVDPEKMDNRQLDLKSKASEVELGSMSFPTIMALGGALDLLMQIGQEQIFQRIMELNAYLEKRLSEINIPIATILEPKHRSGITILKLHNAREIVHKLHEKKIFVSARGAGIRVSVHIFNNFDDIDRLIDELKSISE